MFVLLLLMLFIHFFFDVGLGDDARVDVVIDVHIGFHCDVGIDVDVDVGLR